MENKQKKLPKIHKRWRLIKLKKTKNKKERKIRHSQQNQSQKGKLEYLETFDSIKINKIQSEKNLETTKETIAKNNCSDQFIQQNLPKKNAQRGLEKLKNKIRKIKQTWEGSVKTISPVFKLIVENGNDFFEIHDLSFKGYCSENNQLDEDCDVVVCGDYFDSISIELNNDYVPNFGSIVLLNGSKNWI